MQPKSRRVYPPGRYLVDEPIVLDPAIQYHLFTGVTIQTSEFFPRGSGAIVAVPNQRIEGLTVLMSMASGERKPFLSSVVS